MDTYDEAAPGASGHDHGHWHDLVVAAEMEALEVPYVVVCTRGDSALTYVQGPYPDGVAALSEAIALEDSPEREADAHYAVVPLWRSSSA